MIDRKDIRIRDPFVFTDFENREYYIYGTTDLGAGLGAGNKFSVYKSKDLELFEGLFTIFGGSELDFWATRDFWAAEVHKYKEKYYLFGSFTSDDHVRASQILVSDNPLGKFKPISQEPHTIDGWECLDGTFYIEEGIPYLVFCHEWTQCDVGEIWAVKLKEDLTGKDGEPFMLFKASDNKQVTSIDKNNIKMLTDGPFLFKENGRIKMIWSSFINDRYVVLEAVSDNIRGKWKHLTSRFDFDGGHAMIFTALDGRKYFSLHSPNRAPYERIKLIEYKN